MANLTKKLEKLAKQKIDPIFEELLEQHESAKFHRFLASIREKQQNQITINYIKNQYEKA